MPRRLAAFALLVTSAPLAPAPASAAWTPQGSPVCTAAYDQSGTLIVADGAGGMIACWIDIRHGLNYNQDIYAQRMSGAGTPLWTLDGVAVCTAPNAQDAMAIVPDGSGGVIVCWEDIRHGLNYNQDVYAQRIDASGTPLWTPNGVAVCTAPYAQTGIRAVSDGAGGVIVTWTDIRHGLNYNQDVYAQRVDAFGTPLWTPNGVAVCTAANTQDAVSAVSDGAAGVVVCWEDYRLGLNTNPDIYMQRVGAAGSPLWTPNGVAACTAPNAQFGSKLVADGAGGGIACWEDVRLGLNSNPDIYAQRLDAAGTPLWAPNGVAVCTAPNTQDASQIISDGAGGVIACWEDIRHGLNYNTDLYVQRVDAAGTPVWTPNGVAICTAPYAQNSARMVTDGTSGVIVTFVDIRHGLNYDEDLYAQRVDAGGNVLWTPNGVAVSTASYDQIDPQVVSDGAAGVVVCWQDRRHGLNYNADVFAQWVDAAGTPQCTPDGVALSTAPNAQTQAQIVPDGTGGGIVCWQDVRHGLNSNWDIYAMRLCQCVPGGVCTVPVTVSELRATAGHDGVDLEWTVRGLEAVGRARVLRAEAGTQDFATVSPDLEAPAGADAPMTFRDAAAALGAALDYRVEIETPEGTVVAGPIRVATRAAALALEVALVRPGTARVVFELPRRDLARLEVVAVSGRRVALLEAGVRDAGRGELEWDARGTPAGVYFVRLYSPAGSIAKRLTLW